MVRDAELYFLENIDIQPLIIEIERHDKAHLLKLDIGIFKMGSLPNNFIALSTSIIIDEFLKKNGAIVSPEQDIMRLILPKDHSKAGEFVFGEKDILFFLPSFK